MIQIGDDTMHMPFIRAGMKPRYLKITEIFNMAGLNTERIMPFNLQKINEVDTRLGGLKTNINDGWDFMYTFVSFITWSVQGR